MANPRRTMDVLKGRQQMDAYIVKASNTELSGERREYTVLAATAAEAATKGEKQAARDIEEHKSKTYVYSVELLPTLVR